MPFLLKGGPRARNALGRNGVPAAAAAAAAADGNDEEILINWEILEG